MTRRLRLGAALLAGTFLLAAPALAAAPPKKVGTKINIQTASIGALKLGIKPSQAKALLGKPDSQDKQGFSGNSQNLTMTYARYGLSLHFWQGTQGGTPKLGGIVVTSAQYKANGVGIGSSVSQLQRAIGGQLRCIGKSKPLNQAFCQYARRHADVEFNLSTPGNKVTLIRLGT